MYALEKILAKNSDREVVKTSEIVTCKIDFADWITNTKQHSSTTNAFNVKAFLMVPSS